MTVDPLRVAHRLADAAYDAWLQVRDRTDLDDEMGMGADGTPTTRVDLVLDQAILAVAAEEGVSVLSEESGLTDHGSDLVAVVDPLDGSRNAGRGIPFHCTSIAVGHDDLLHLDAAVVKHLVTADVFEAQRGKGARFNGVSLAPRKFDPEDVMVAIIADSSVDEVKQEQERRGHHMRDLGSAALELCYVGTGGLDAFIVRRPWLRVIDVAAGVLFVREAGGHVLDPRGGDLATPFDLSLRIGLIAAHDQHALEAVR